MINSNILSKLTKADIIAEPFPHLAIKNAVEPELFETLSRTFPSENLVIRTDKPENNTLYLYPWRDAQEEDRLTTLWKEFAGQFTSRAFFLEIVRLFGDRIEELFHLSQIYNKPLEQFTIGLRKGGRWGTHLPENHEGDVTMDTQFCMNSPVTAPSRVRGPHLDNGRKLYAGLLYFRQPHDDSTGSDLMLYRYRSTRVPTGVDYDLDDRHVEHVKSVEYRANTFVFWINSLHALHGVSPRSKTNVTRRFLNVIGELNTHPSGVLFDTKRGQYA